MPIATGTALAIGGIAGAAGSVAGGALAAHGAGQQAQAAERSSQAAIAEQRREFDIQRQMLQPWVGAGGAAVQRLAFLLGLSSPGGTAAGGSPNPLTGGAFDRDAALSRFRRLRQFDGEFGRFGGSPTGFPGDILPVVPQPTDTTSTGNLPAGANPGDFGSLMRDFTLQDFQTDPGYEFRLSEGAKALERSAAAKGALFSGGTLKALDRYNQDFASNEFTNAYNRFQSNRATRYNFLSSLAGLGQVSAGQVANLAGETGRSIADLTVGGATAAAAARASGYGALAQGIGGASNSLSNWLLLQSLMKQNQGAGA